jgi:hypothetical protein
MFHHSYVQLTKKQFEVNATESSRSAFLVGFNFLPVLIG